MNERRRPGPERRRIVGIAVWAVSWGFAAAAIWLSLGFDLPRQPLPGLVLSQASPEIRALFPLIGVTVAVVYGPVAALLLSHRINAVGVILAVHGVGSAIGAFGVQWGLLGAQQAGLPLWGLLAFASGWCYIPGTFMTAVLPVLVTRSRLPRWQLLLVFLGAANAALATLASLVQQSVPEPVNPLAIPPGPLRSALPEVYLWASFVAVAMAAVTGVILLTRWVRARGRGRTGLAWLTLGHLFLTAGYAMLVLPENRPLPGLLAEYALLTPIVGQVIYPAGILVVVLGQGLWGQRVVVSRVILWSLLTVSGVALYFGIVLTVPRFVPWPEGLQLLVPVLIAIAIQPMRSWIQRRIDQLVYGEGADPAALISRLSEHIGDLEAGPAGLRELSEALRRVLRLASVEVRSGVTPLSAIAGEPVGEPVRIALLDGGELIVSAPGGQRLDRRSLSVLRDLSGLVSVALHLVESNRHLDVARDDFFARRAGERRAIQRELHDGLGPALAGIGFGLAAATNLVRRDPERARALLAELGQDLARRARSVRELAGEVSSSPLDGAALPVALRELAARFCTDQMTVRVAIDTALADGRQLPQRHQDAVYLIAAEALTNAARHSGASRVAIDLERRGSEVRLSIVDDGRGLPESYAPGVGLASLRQRAEALGGTLRLSSSSDGVGVVAMLPVAMPTG